MTQRRIRRRIPRERLAVEPSPEQREAWAFHHANLRARLAAGRAGDMAEVIRLRLAMHAYDDEHP